MLTKKTRKRFSIHKRLMLIFGCLLTIAAIAGSLIAIRTARKAVTEKIEAHLIDRTECSVGSISGTGCVAHTEVFYIFKRSG